MFSWSQASFPQALYRNEGLVLATVDSVNSFLNPFGIPDKDNLYCISSGCKMSQDIERDVVSAECKGEDQKEAFIEERLKRNDNFFQPIKRLKLKTMEDNSRRVKITSTKSKVIEVRQHTNIAFQWLIKSQSLGKILKGL